MADKLTADIKIHASDALELDLRRLADRDGRSLSDYCRFVLSRHVYGYRAASLEKSEGAKCGESGRE